MFSRLVSGARTTFLSAPATLRCAGRSRLAFGGSLKRALKWRGGSVGVATDYQHDAISSSGGFIKPQQRRMSTDIKNESEKPRVLFVLGGPGSGKGTQCQKMAGSFPFMHLSAGELLRAERDRKDSEVGDLINRYITEGKIVPVDITVSLLKAEMERGQQDGKRWFLIDGFPRSHENLRGWSDVIGDWANVVGVIFLDCPEEEMERRILHRAQTEGRNDDNLATVKKRFRTYEAETMPVIDHYRSEKKLFTVSACGNMEEVCERVETLVKSLTDFTERDFSETDRGSPAPPTA
eukprot:CAMPEP_0184478794 /NCGR_PEP_ID=MMETSP0113_2-20130426/720_1 /TAXON_ID=91329 /ORGANISM="Norrisiella sphaerica, Strain BC52" /LENGTH=292 /DNA_ID=CAMNT_0026856699 /DNA_START=138 /DNA_END=1019 /DNA_ORIENTATION=+